MSPNAIAALRALHDVGAVSARWMNPGYRELRQRNLASAPANFGVAEPIHTLTPRGKNLAEHLFKRKF
jgi:hypothetical protein